MGWGIACGSLVTLGLVNTLVYAGQFSFYRMTRRSECAECLPIGYYECLCRLRAGTPGDAIVLDTICMNYRQSLWTTNLGDAVPFFPRLLGWMSTCPIPRRRMRGTLGNGRSATAIGAATEFQSQELSRYFARQADYLILLDEAKPGNEWHVRESIPRVRSVWFETTILRLVPHQEGQARVAPIHGGCSENAPKREGVSLNRVTPLLRSRDGRNVVNRSAVLLACLGWFREQVGGAAKIATEWAANLAEQGWRVSYVCGSEEVERRFQSAKGCHNKIQARRLYDP